MTDPAALLELIIAKAEGLRLAGVQKIEFEGVKLDLAPAPIAPAHEEVPAAQEAEGGGFDDPFDLTGDSPNARRAD